MAQKMLLRILSANTVDTFMYSGGKKSVIFLLSGSLSQNTTDFLPRLHLGMIFRKQVFYCSHTSLEKQLVHKFETRESQ